MKNLILSVLFVLAPLTSFAWAPHTQYYMTPQYAQVQIYNPTYATAFCQGYTYGMTQAGQTVYSFFSAYVPPYGFQYAYIYANGPFYFINAWADLDCWNY